MTTKPIPRQGLSPEKHKIWAKFDAEIEKGLADIAAGRLKDADDVFDRLEAKYAAMSRPHG